MISRELNWYLTKGTKTKTDKQEKMVQPGVHEISPVGIYGEVYGVKNLKKRCVLSLEWKREGVIDGESGDDDSVDPTCVINCTGTDNQTQQPTEKSTKN